MMIVEKQRSAINQQQQQLANGDFVSLSENVDIVDDDEEDADNDEENIVIDMVDEDDEEDELMLTSSGNTHYVRHDESLLHQNGHHLHQHQVSSFATTHNKSNTTNANHNHNNNNIINNNNTKVDVSESSEFSDEANTTNADNNTTSHLLQQFAVGDPVWFDPNQLGYCVPGQVVDYYPDLNMLTIEGHAQPQNGEFISSNGQLDNDNDNEQLTAVRAEPLQLYDLSDPQQFRSIRPRLPTSSARGFADLTQLEELSLESIIWNLRLRHKQQLVYTSCGPRILLSVNPFQQLPEVYNLEQVNKHDSLNSAELATRAESGSQLLRWLLLEDKGSRATTTGEQQQNEELREPHIFGVANEALKRLLIDQQDQCFVLLGESGSGKTEACKLLVQYLATVNKSPSNLMTEQILESIQLLESFGNAKTALNDNASRFGKLLEVRFQLASGFISSARTCDLGLLDRTRIVSQSEGERNYHIFYELLAGLSRAEKEKYGLQSAEKYFYLNQGHCVELNNKEDGDDFRALLASMQVLGFNYEEQDTVFRLLASVLHLGNVYFHRKVLAVRSGKLAAAAGDNLAGVEGVEIGSDTEVRWVSHLLQIQFDSVMRCLSVRTTDSQVINASQCDPQQQVHVERIVTPLNIDQALDTRDAIACTLYTCLFKWLVQRINAMINGGRSLDESGDNGALNQDEQSVTDNEQVLEEPTYLCRTSESLCEFQPDKLDSQRATSLSRVRRQNRQSERRRRRLMAASASVSILDAFGFENLTENNFEQLCINYAAELLQYHTSRYLLRLEQAEYARERLRWTPIQMGASLSTTTTTQQQQLNPQPQIASSTGDTNLASLNNQPVVNLLAKKPLGVLALLDDECNFPKATDQSFAEKCHHNHTLNENYQRARLAANSQEFGVRHFRLASRLTWYQVEGFVEKNRDALRPDVAELLMNSKMAIVGDMLRKLHQQQDPLQSSKTLSRTYDGRYVCMKPRARTLAARFQDNLQNNRVLEALNCQVRPSSVAVATAAAAASNQQANKNNNSHQLVKPEPWFVLCLKPNKSRAAHIFDVAYLQEQVRALGLRELAHLRKVGYPVRLRYADFVRRYKCLVPHKFLESLASYEHLQVVPHTASQPQQQQQATKRAVRDVCGAMLDFRLTAQYARPLYQCGLTKMFLNEQLYLKLERLRLIEHQRAVSILQRTLRMWQVRSEYLMKRRAAIVIQSHLRAYLARQHFWRQYSLIVALQRRWRHLLQQRRRRELENRRRQHRLKQQHQLQEVQLQQRKQANQFRFRQTPGQQQVQSSGSGGHYATTTTSSRLDIPEELAQLYRIQRDRLPVHDHLTQLAEIDLDELIEREQRRFSSYADDNLSVPYLTEGFERSLEGELDSAEATKLIAELEADERYSLQRFISAYFPLEAPQFGYSRLPITRPFTWCRLVRGRRAALRRSRNEQQVNTAKRRFEAIELQATVTYKLLLRFIDSDLSSNVQDNQQQQQSILRFKLIADYIIHLCLAEPLLRDEIYLQLVSQSWANPREKSTENVWRLMANCVSCFTPRDKHLSKFLLRYVSEYCCERYRDLLVHRFLFTCAGATKSMHQQSSRRYPPSVLEYWANQNARGRLALTVSCYMDDELHTGAAHLSDDDDQDLGNLSNRSGKTLVKLESNSRAEQLAAAVLRTRQVPEHNLLGWSLEVQHEGAESEMSSPLRGDDLLLDHLARIELLPEFADLIECAQEQVTIGEPGVANADRCFPQQQQQQQSEENMRLSRQHSPVPVACCAPQRTRKLSLSEFSTPSLSRQQYQQQRNSMISQRSSDTSAGRRNSSYMSASELGGYAPASSSSRLSQTSKLNRRYLRTNYAQQQQPNELDDYQQHNNFDYELDNNGIISPVPHNSHHSTRHLHRRSMSMQELQLASSALNGRYFGGNGRYVGNAQAPAMMSSHYASSYVSPPPQVMGQRNPKLRHEHRRSGSLQQLSRGEQQVNYNNVTSERPHSRGSRRRSQTPNSMMMMSTNSQHRMSSSAYGSESHRSYVTSSSELTANTDHQHHHNQRQSRRELLLRGQQQVNRSEQQQQVLGRGMRPRRSTSSSSRALFTHTNNRSTTDHHSDYASTTHSDYERLKPLNTGYAAAAPPLPLPASALEQPASYLPGERIPANHDYSQQQRRPPSNRKRMAPRAPTGDPTVNQRLTTAAEPQVDYNQSHYVASSAMSDTGSEAPSLASHVRGVKVPQHNADVNQYLDDLFQPMLDEAELDELSDARSLATSIRGTRSNEAAPDEGEATISVSPTQPQVDEGHEERQVSEAVVEVEAASDELAATARLSPTFETLLEGLRSNAELGAAGVAPGVEEAPLMSRLGDMNLAELKALNEKLEQQIQTAQLSHQRTSSLEPVLANDNIPVPPPEPDLRAPLEDLYSRARTVRIGKVRWPPARDEQQQQVEQQVPDTTEAQIVSYFESRERKRLSSSSSSSIATTAQQQSSEDSSVVSSEVQSQKAQVNESCQVSKKAEQDAKMMPPPPTPLVFGGSVGKLKISSEMKAKLEQLTTGSGRESATPTPATTAPGIVSQTKSLLMASDSSSEVKRLGDQRRKLLEKQLLGSQQEDSAANAAVNSNRSSMESNVSSSGKVLAAKQQLAAAAGVALAAFDGGSQASSRRQSSNIGDNTNAAKRVSGAEEPRQSRVLHDELGPQSRAAISQREAFYQMSASSDQIDNLSEPMGSDSLQQKQQVHSGSEQQLRIANQEFIPPPTGGSFGGNSVSSDDLQQVATSSATAGHQQVAGNQAKQQQQPAQLTRSMQMSANLNEAGQSSALGQESERIYGQSIAKSLSQRQHESLLEQTANRKQQNSAQVSGSHTSNQWVASPEGSTSRQRNNQSQRVKRTGSGVSNCERRSSSKRLTTRRSATQQTNITCNTALAYSNVNWQVKIRKEFFLPSETYDDPLVVQLIFAQLVADVFNPRHWTTRLNHKERAAIKALMKDNSIGYAASLPQIGYLQEVKRELVRMARSFGLYFTRSYAASNLALTADTLCAAAGQWPSGGRGARSASVSPHSSGSASDGELESEKACPVSDGPVSEQALRLLRRLRNADNLGADWIDMVAVHHSGLRLVTVVKAANEQLGTLPGGSGKQHHHHQQQQQQVGYKVIETLKYRDMTDVSQLGQSELLVSMRNGKKCWLISSSQATQLGSLLRCFHADYNEHLQQTGSTTTKTATTTTKQQQQLQVATDKSGGSGSQVARSSLVQKTKQLNKKRANNDALLAPHDDHHGDHLAQRQTTDGFAKLRKTTHSNDDLAYSERVLSDHLASSLATRANQPNQPTGGAHQKANKSGVALEAAASPSASASSTDQQQNNNNKLDKSKKNLWQNSISRMSNKFSIFGSQSRATGANRCESSVATNHQAAGNKKHQMAAPTQQQQQQLTLDAWIEAKVDFDEDDEIDLVNNKNNNNNNNSISGIPVQQKSVANDEQQQQQQSGESLSEMGSLRSKRSQRTTNSANDQLDGKLVAPTGNSVSAAQASPSGVEADGKHSLLQFALYNFREAIDKYSLESRANKAQLAPGDTSTLRGSLKLIETLRSARSSDSGHGSSSGKSERKSRLHSTGNRLSTANANTTGDWTWRELAEMVKFTSVPIQNSLLKLPSEDLNKRALDCFQALMQYMGDAPVTRSPTKGNSAGRAGSQSPGMSQQADEVECVYLILMNCHNYPLLRDELYCQLMKQTTSNRSNQPDSCLRGWRLFSIVAAYFDCSDAFRPYLLKYLETAAYDKRRAYCSVAALCLQNLRKTLKYGGRKNVPSIEEIAATSAGRNSKRQIYRLPGGTERVINTKSTTVVDDIIHEICANMLSVTEPQEMLEFSLYCIADGDLYTMPLNRDEYILDITTELIKNHQQYFLIFCRSIWHYPLRLDSKLYIEVIFNQIAPDYLEGLLLVLPHLSQTNSRSTSRSKHSDSGDSSLRSTAIGVGPLRLKSKLVREIARIAALLHRASGTDYMPAKDEVKYLLPKPIISAMKQYQRALTSAGVVVDSSSSSLVQNNNNSLERPGPHTPEDELTQVDTPQRWIELVQSNWRDMSAFDTLDAKAQFLDIVRHWPLFGSSFFAIKLIQRDLIQPLDFILALNKLGIQMLDTSTHETIHKYPFNEVISTRKVRSEDGALFLDLKCGNLMKRTIIRIQTDQAHEISRLIRQYIDIELLQQKQLQINSIATSQQLSMSGG